MTRQSLEVSGYDDASVRAALLSSGRTLRFRYEHLDPDNQTLGDLDGVITGGKITHNTTADIKRSATFTINEAAAGPVDWLNDRIRPWIGVGMPDGGWAEWPQGVFLLSTPVRKYVAGSITRAVTAYDQTQVLVDQKAAVRYPIVTGAVVTDQIAALMAKFQTNIAASTRAFGYDRSVDPGSTELAILQYLLTSITYEHAFDGYGVDQIRPYVAPEDDASGWTYATDSESVIYPEVDQTLDLFGVANVFIRIVSQADRPLLTATYRNDNPGSPTSTVSRGREITDYVDNSDAIDQAALNAEARQAAITASQVYEQIQFSTVIMPFHGDHDVVTLQHSGLGVSADYSETDWEITLQAGGAMTHTVQKIVNVDPEAEAA